MPMNAKLLAGLLVAVLMSTTTKAMDWLGPDGAHDLERLIAEHPLPPGEGFSARTLSEGAQTKHVVVQVRDRERVHYHADSDLTVVMLRGHGTLHLGDRELFARTGDVLHVPRGTVHWFENEDASPAAALVIYAPPPGPNDRVPVDR